jgi:hypothetical protein
MAFSPVCFNVLQYFEKHNQVCLVVRSQQLMIEKQREIINKLEQHHHKILQRFGDANFSSSIASPFSSTTTTPAMPLSATTKTKKRTQKDMK